MLLLLSLLFLLLELLEPLLFGLCGVSQLSIEPALILELHLLHLSCLLLHVALRLCCSLDECQLLLLKRFLLSLQKLLLLLLLLPHERLRISELMCCVDELCLGLLLLMMHACKSELKHIVATLLVKLLLPENLLLLLLELLLL